MSEGMAGKSVLITGAGRGLGRAYGEALAAAGANVLINDVDAAEANAAAEGIVAAGGIARAHSGTIATWDGAAAAVEECISAFGAIDGLVNNAGLFHNGPPWEETEQVIRDLVEVNVVGALFVGVHAMRAMADAGGGAIVNLTSEAHLGLPTMATYAATKGALASLTYAWAWDLAERNIRVNGLAPVGFTRMTPAWAPPGSRPSPASVAPIVVFLLSDRAAAITGKVVHFNGTTLTPVVAPHKAAESVAKDLWSVDDIAEACTGPLAPALLAPE